LNQSYDNLQTTLSGVRAEELRILAHNFILNHDLKTTGNFLLRQTDLKFDVCESAFGNVMRGEDFVNRRELFGRQCMMLSGLTDPYAVTVFGKNLYVAEQAGTVKVIDKVTGELNGTLQVPVENANLTRVVVNPMQKLIYVSGSSISSIFVFSLATGSLLRNITVVDDAQIYGLALNADASFLYVSDTKNGRVLKISTETETLTQSWELESPRQLSVLQNEDVLVLQNRDVVYQFSGLNTDISAGSFLNISSKNQTGYPYNFGTMYAEQDRLYLSVWNTGEVKEYFFNGTLRTTWESNTLGGIFGLSMDADSHILYASSFSDGKLLGLI